MELATPITIFWDLPAGATDAASLLRICDEVVACRPLMLHLRDPGPRIGTGTVAVLERLKGMGIAVSLAIPPTALDDATFTSLQDLGVKEILLSAEAVEVLPSSLQGVGISFAVTRENWRELPVLVALCRERGTARLVLPMQRLYDGESPFFLTRPEQEELALSLASAGGVEGLGLTIHDPFLWRAFNPGVPFPQGGCQAANTMLAIAPDGGVYPCPTLPVRLGDVAETRLKEIVSSAAKKAFRRRLLEHPGDCRGCGELAECRGGCRGRGYVIHGSLDGVDEACR